MRLISRQSWNPLALIATARTLIRRPGLLVPHVAVRNVDELNYDALRAAGVADVVLAHLLELWGLRRCGDAARLGPLLLGDE